MSTALGPEDVFELCPVAEVALAGGGMEGTVREGMSEGVEGLVGHRTGCAWADDVVIGVGAVCDGVIGEEAMAGEGLGASRAELLVAMGEFLSRVDTYDERGWVEGVSVRVRDIGHGSVVRDGGFPRVS